MGGLRAAKVIPANVKVALLMVQFIFKTKNPNLRKRRSWIDRL
jgi:hypothetical protein